MNLSHDDPRFCDPDYMPHHGDVYEELDLEPRILCAGCGDSEVAFTDEICDVCLESSIEDWRHAHDYRVMRALAAKNGQLRKVVA